MPYYINNTLQRTILHCFYPSVDMSRDTRLSEPFLKDTIQFVETNGCLNNIEFAIIPSVYHYEPIFPETNAKSLLKCLR